MPLLYRDSFQDDEQVINLLASMRVVNPLAAQPAAQPGPHMPRHGRPRPRVVDVSDDSDTNDDSNAAGPNVVRDRSAAAPVRGVVRPLIGPVLRRLPVPTPVLDDEAYNVTSGRRTGVRNTWADAGDATQGVPGGHVIRIQVLRPRNRRRHGPRAAYVVFEGLAPGIYSTWGEVRPLVNGIPGNIHQGFDSRREAERAYVVAFALGALRILPTRLNPGRVRLSSAIPTPEALMAAFTSASHNFLGAEWHVVFKGKRPGIYPAWNFAATQTKGVSSAIYKKYSSKAEAEEAFRLASDDGFVQAL